MGSAFLCFLNDLFHGLLWKLFMACFGNWKELWWLLFIDHVMCPQVQDFGIKFWNDVTLLEGFNVHFAQETTIHRERTNIQVSQAVSFFIFLTLFLHFSAWLHTLRQMKMLANEKNPWRTRQQSGNDPMNASLLCSSRQTANRGDAKIHSFFENNGNAGQCHCWKHVTFFTWGERWKSSRLWQFVSSQQQVGCQPAHPLPNFPLGFTCRLKSKLGNMTTNNCKKKGWLLSFLDFLAALLLKGTGEASVQVMKIWCMCMWFWKKMNYKWCPLVNLPMLSTKIPNELKWSDGSQTCFIGSCPIFAWRYQTG